ncbi:pyridoxal phosphatase [Gallibacterium sp. AGMB14963]|uniref:pyridoxal phosphatase n=1 Tax=Gallibacterium faecale TaxID=3019086 RepID=UPI0022F1A708|nr:pyridoxal phosphatase [Gallibacterium sp. AGMB14963]MDA3978290.1 pyridoxal phosphatase [Gallibacterium sp. AGMB14963]
MDYQVIAFDLDGTLLNSEGKILPSSLVAIQRAKAQGKKVVLVTGRHHTAVKPYYYELGLDTPVVCCNGTYLYQMETDTVLAANPLTAEKAQKILDLAYQYGSHVLLYSRDAMNFQTFNPHMEKFKAWAESCAFAVRPKVQQVPDLYHFITSGDIIWKCVISAPSREVMLKVVNELPEEQFSCEWSWIDRVDIANVGNSKGERLLELLATWGIQPEQVIAFGDNHNDTSMLTAVGLGVTMGNAEEEVKQQAKLVTKSNDDDGIAQVLAEYLD